MDGPGRHYASQISQTERQTRTNTIRSHLLVESKKKECQAHRYREQVGGCQMLEVTGW